MEHRRFTAEEEMHAAVVEILSYHMGRPLTTPHAVMLSGGTTPLPVYNYFEDNPPPVSDTLHIVFSDERMVPVDSENNNYANARGMIDALGIPEKRILRVDTSLKLEEAAEEYNNKLNVFLDTGGRITLGLLGLGTEGHTASLFSFDDINREKKRLAVAVTRNEEFDRVSVTPELLQKVDMIVFLVSGSRKSHIVKTFLTNPQEIPAGRAVQNVKHVEIWQS